METCEYEQVDTGLSKWRPFLRQLLVCSSIWLSQFTLGMCNGAPTVIIPQLRREANSTEAVSDEMASWMSSAQSYAALPWLFFLPMFTKRCGRKLPFLFVSFCTFCSFIVFFFSSSVTHILIGEVIQGTINAGSIAVNIIIITEYSTPRYRGVFLTLKSASYNWGLWCSNALGTFFHWKTIAIAGMFSSSYYIVNAIFWTESPIWLASKGYFEKCTESHRWLKGTDEYSEKELKSIIESQKIYKMNVKSGTNKSNLKIFLSPDFLKPTFLCLALTSLYNFNGKLVCVIYAVDLLKKITGSESTAYTGMLILDGITVFGMYIGSALSKFLKRRTLLFSASSIGILFLYLVSLYLYLIKLSVIVENNYVSISLMSMFSFAITCGPMLMCTTLYGELMPLRFVSSAVFIVGFNSNFLSGTLFKIAPYLFKTIKLHGVFLFFGMTSTVFTILLYKYLPETKDKTLIEIEDYFKAHSKNKCNKKENQAILIQASGHNNYEGENNTNRNVT